MPPIDVGPPTFTNRTLNTTINGTNLSSAMRLWMWDDNFGGIADQDWAIYFDSLVGIHGNTVVKLGAAPSAGQLQTNLHLLNPLGYNNQIITQVLLDFLRDQMHVGCGVARLRPSSDGTGTWIPSTGTAKWSTIDDPLDEPGNAKLLDYIATSTAGDAQRIGFPALPSNVYRVQEAIVAFWGLMTKGPSGSDEGLGFGFQYQSTAFGNLSRKLIADMYANGDVQARRVKLDRINSGGLHPTGPQFNAGWLNITAERGTAGPSPNPYWRIHALEMVVYYEINEPAYEVLDTASFSSLDSTYLTHLLDFDIIDTTGYSALLDILAHAPELFLYVDYLGKLKLGRIVAHADAVSPRALSTADGSITEVLRGPYWYDERSANAVELRWGVTIPHTSSGTATEDPDNPPTDRGNRKYPRGAAGVPVTGWEDIKILKRHFIRRDSNKDVAESIAAAYLRLWGKNRRGVKAMDLACPYACIDVEQGDTVSVTAPGLGISSKRFLCVEKSFDLEKDRLLLTVYDVENT